MVVRLQESNEETLTAVCDICGTRVPLDTTTMVDGEILCDDCLGSNTFECGDCGTRHLLSNTYTVISPTGGEYDVCSECRSDYWYCGHCGNYYYTEDFDSDLMCCNNCRESLDAEGIVYRDERILNAYGYKPKPKFIKDKKESTKRFFGMEIELGDCNACCHTKNFYSAINNNGRSAYLKSDSSIRGGGYECVTHPMTSRKLHQWLDESLAPAIADVYNSLSTDGCGVHIHVSRDSIGTLTLLKVTTMLNLLRGKANYKFIQFLTGREREQLNHWCKVTSELQLNLLLRIKNKDSLGDRYLAVNHNNLRTIEFRLFNGTTSVDTLHRYLDILESLLDYCANTALQDVSIGGWLEYVIANKGAYPFFKAHIIGQRTDTQTGKISHYYRIPADAIPDKYNQFFLWTHNYSGTLRRSTVLNIVNGFGRYFSSIEESILSSYARLVGEIPVKELIEISKKVESFVFNPVLRRRKSKKFRRAQDCNSGAPLRELDLQVFGETISHEVLQTLAREVREATETIMQCGYKKPRLSNADTEGAYKKLTKTKKTKAELVLN